MKTKYAVGILALIVTIIAGGTAFAGTEAAVSLYNASNLTYNTVLLPTGDDTTVADGGLIAVDQDDSVVEQYNRDLDIADSTIALKGTDTSADFVLDDLIQNSTVTVEAGGEVSATAVYNTADSLTLYTSIATNSAVLSRGIDADEGDLMIDNAGLISASMVVNSANLEAHAMGVQIHNYNSSNLNPLTTVTNSGDILASAINYNSLNSSEATARGIQVGGASYNALGNLTIDNSGTIAASAMSRQASSRGIKIGGASGDGSLYNTTIINDGGTISATTTSSYEASAWVVQTGGYLEELTIENSGDMLATANADSTTASGSADSAAYANTRVLKLGDFMEDVVITNDGTMAANSFAVGDEDDANLDSNARGVHIGKAVDGFEFTNNGTLIVNAATLGIDGDDDYLSNQAVANASAIHMGYNSASVTIINNNVIDVDASAEANTTGNDVNVSASGVHLGSGADQGDPDVNEDFTFDNSGTFTVTASATADEEAYNGVTASAKALHLGTSYNAVITNSNVIDVDATSSVADGGNADASAHAEAYHIGFDTEELTLTDTGVVTVDASASGGDLHYFSNASAFGVKLGESLYNAAITTTDLTVNASADADYTYSDGDGNVSAAARGVQLGYDTTNVVINSDQMVVTATAEGDDIQGQDYNSEAGDWFSVSSSARGVQMGYNVANVEFDSATLMDISATTTVTDDTDDKVASNARAIQAGNEISDFDVTTAGVVNVTATTTLAEGAELDDDLNAHADFVHMGYDTTDVTIDNSADLTVFAGVEMLSEDADVDDMAANANGVHMGYNAVNFSMTNSGTMDITAEALYGDYVSGVDASASAVHLGGDYGDSPPYNVTILNSGAINVSASAEGSENDDEQNVHATGIQLGSGAAEVSITNSGSMTVDALATSDFYVDDEVNVSARGIKMGENPYNTAIISNDLAVSGTVDVFETSDEVSVSARGIEVGEDNTNDAGYRDVDNITIQSTTLDVSANVFSTGEIGENGYGIDASSFGIKVGDELQGVDIDSGDLTASVNVDVYEVDSGIDTSARGIMIAGYVEDITVDSTGNLVASSTATVENYVGSTMSTNARGLMVGGYLYNAAINLNNVDVDAVSVSEDFSDSDVDAEAEGIHTGGYVEETTITLAGAMDVLASASAFDGGDIQAVARGIKTGGYLYNTAINVNAPMTVAAVAAASEDVDEVQANAWGIQTGEIDGGFTITNSGGMTVTATADGGSADADPTGYDVYAIAMGIKTDDVYNTAIVNDAALSVTATGNFSGVETDDDPYTEVKATGIHIANNSENYTITNNSAITVAATASGAIDLDGDSNGATGIKVGSYSLGTVTNSEGATITVSADLAAEDIDWSDGAVGIRVGTSYEDSGVYNAVVLNEGTIAATVSIDTDKTDQVEIDEDVFDGVNYNRGAFGIRTGTAQVVNNNTITATATMDGMNDSSYDGAYGIRTGEGDALVVNTGSITATLTDNDTSTTQRAVGIMTGMDGNEIHQSGTITATATGGDAYSVVVGCADASFEPEESALPDPNAVMILDGAEMVGDMMNESLDDEAFVAFGFDSVDGMADFGPEYANAAELIAAIEMAPGMEERQIAIYNGTTVDEDFTFTFNDDFLGEEGWNALLMGGATIINNSDASTFEEMIVGVDALLGGDAFVGNLEAFGDLAPGDGGVGTITVDGDLYQGPESTYFVELDYSGSDLIDVTGDAYVEDGAMVDVSTIGYVAEGAYTIMAADGALLYNSALTNLTVPDSLVLTYELEVDDVYNTVILNAGRETYEEIGVVSNGISAGDALIDMAAAGDEQANDLMDVLDNSTDLELIQEILSSLAPEQYGAFLDLSSIGFAGYGDLLASNMGSNHLARVELNKLSESGPVLSRQTAFDRDAMGWSTWAQALAKTGDQDDDGDLAGYDYDTTAIAFGFDNKLSENLVLGLSLGFGNTDADFDYFNQSTDMDSTYGSVYGTYAKDALYVDAALSIASNDYDSDRILVLGPEEMVKVTSSTDGSEVGLYIGGGYYMVDTDTMYFAPTASLSWSQIDVDGFTEKGAGSLNLEVDDYDSTSTVTTLGFRFGGKLGVMEPEFRLAWAHDFGDDDREVTVKYVGGPTEFKIEAVEPEMDSALIGLGAKFLVSEDFTLYLDYDGELRSDFESHTISGGMRYNF